MGINMGSDSADLHFCDEDSCGKSDWVNLEEPNFFRVESLLRSEILKDDGAGTASARYHCHRNVKSSQIK